MKILRRTAFCVLAMSLCGCGASEGASRLESACRLPPDKSISEVTLPGPVAISEYRRGLLLGFADNAQAEAYLRRLSQQIANEPAKASLMGDVVISKIGSGSDIFVQFNRRQSDEALCGALTDLIVGTPAPISISVVRNG